MSSRPRRSVLYMPGSNARALEKAKTLDADGVILDLEDAVAPDAKETAREQVVGAVKAGGFGFREVIVRVNGPDTPWGAEDMKAACAAGPDAVLVPKIDTAADIAAAQAAMKEAGAPEQTKLWVMMETPLAMLNARDIAAEAAVGGSRLEGFVMGTNDLAKELHCQQVPGREPMISALGLCMLAARAYGLIIIDGVFNGIQDTDGFVQVCRQGFEMGFDGKTLIHPSQIEPCNREFSPADEEVAWARKISDAFDLPENKGQGVIKVEGRMVELLHAEEARRLVSVADAIAARG